MQRATELERDQAQDESAPEAMKIDADGPRDVVFSSQGALPPVAEDQQVQHLSASDRAFGPTATPPKHDRHEGKEYGKPTDAKADSHRFGGDAALEAVAAGTKTVKKGDHSLAVEKLQQALVDLGYNVPYGVDGIFGDGTLGALAKFQADNGLTASNELDKETVLKLHELYDTRKPYVDNATHDAKDPGTRKLTANQKKSAYNAMVPPKGAGGAPAKFTEEVGGEKYGDRIRDGLTTIIDSLHKELFDDKVDLRKDPTNNFHEWSTIEGPAKAAKDVTDTLYDTNYGGAIAHPAMTFAGGNLVDQWEDEQAINKGLDKGQKKDKAREKVWYLINSNLTKINREHGAVASGAQEKKILKPIVEGFINDEKKVQRMLDLDIGWEGAQLDGIVYLQRYKSQNTDKDKAKEENRVQMWELFHTCIHEYLHTCAHPKYLKYAHGLDSTRYNTLVEGFCDFFTLNVRSTVDPKSVQKTVEGPYANGNAPAAVKSGVYPSHRDAEHVVSIVGIKNAQAAYFRGETQFI
jgi:peptidoglycan hydrolase-like protein with peptidoglycan-binding domain